MKRSLRRSIFIFFLGFSLIFVANSCKTKEGCEATQQYSQESDINNVGKKSKRGKSNLFSKKTRKKMNKNK